MTTKMEENEDLKNEVEALKKEMKKTKVFSIKSYGLFNFIKNNHSQNLIHACLCPK